MKSGATAPAATTAVPATNEPMPGRHAVTTPDVAGSATAPPVAALAGHAAAAEQSSLVVVAETGAASTKVGSVSLAAEVVASAAPLAAGPQGPRIEAPSSRSVPPPEPAAQIATAVVSHAADADGTTRLTVRLDPVELGTVEIRIDRPHDAPAKVEVMVERPETMTMLARDQHDLHRALDQAGVPSEGRSVTFTLASNDQPAQREARPDSGGGAAMGEGSSNRSTGDDRGGGGSPGHRPNGQSSATITRITLPPAQWGRSSLDITA
jgi:flagellar hook-length control protein FliK